MTRVLLIATFSAIAALSGCTQLPSRPPTATPTSEAPPSTTAVPPAAPPTTESPAEPRQSRTPGPAPPAPTNGNASATPPNAPPAARSPPKATPSAPEASPAPKPPVAAAPAAPASPPLDLAGLEQRLRDTNAIGVFTKLSLKNQVNDLLDEFREFHDGKINVPLADLRQQYEQLLLKVVTLLQDADAPLARAVSSSREAIWGILVDPKTFAKI
jgi:hypothetical protein